VKLLFSEEPTVGLDLIVHLQVMKLLADILEEQRKVSDDNSFIKESG